MRKIFSIVITIMVITSCKKNSVPEPVKIIEQVIIAPEYFVQKKNTVYYVGIQINKNYTDADQVSLSFNGVEGTQIFSSNEVLEGNLLLFTMPPVNQAIEGKLKVIVKNNQNTFTKEMTYRIVDDFNINSVWDYLNKNYMLSLDGVRTVRILPNGFIGSGFKATGSINGVPFASITKNSYFDDDLNMLDKFSPKRLPNPFINGLKGRYIFTHPDNALTNLTVLQGGTANGYYIPQNIYNDLATAFGNPISQSTVNGRKITTYNNSNFNIITYETSSNAYLAELGDYFGPGMYTVITKK